jgi:hypothetical protein
MIIAPVKVLIEHLKIELLAVVLIICSINVHPSTLVVGDNIEQIRLQDQFKMPYASTIDTTNLLFSRSMKDGTIVEQALKNTPLNSL